MVALNYMQRGLLVSLVGLPVVVFIVLLVNPAWDPAPSLPVFHFYIVTFTSLIALVVASFVLAGIGTTGSVQSTFVAMSFIAMSGVFLTHGVLTPGIAFNHEHIFTAVGWAARLSLLVGGVLLAISLADLPPQAQRWVAVNRRILWILLALGLLLHVYISFDFPIWLEQIVQNQFLSGALAIANILILMWSALRAYRLYNQTGASLPLALSIGLPWLALAQLSQYAAPLWALSWWMYHLMMLMAFSLAMIALVAEYEQILDFKLTRYYVSLSIIAAAVLAGAMAEFAVQLTGGVEALRWPLIAVSLAAFALFFLIVYLVVRHGSGILDQRANALRREKQWRTDFTNLLVHDLKSPIASVRGSLQMLVLTDKGELAAEQRRFIQRADQSSREIVGMVDNLLDVERLEGGAIPFSPGFVDLASILRESADSIRDAATVNLVSLNVTIPDTLPLVEADQNLIRRVTLNLLANALKFAPANGYIYLLASATKSMLTVSVTDNGPGIPVADRERIFDKFVQGQGADRGGAGLGLTFCKLALDLHRGRVWVEDNPSGGAGSTFVYTLPILQPNGS